MRLNGIGHAALVGSDSVVVCHIRRLVYGRLADVAVAPAVTRSLQVALRKAAIPIDGNSINDFRYVVVGSHDSVIVAPAESTLRRTVAEVNP